VSGAVTGACMSLRGSGLNLFEYIRSFIPMAMNSDLSDFQIYEKRRDRV
jgi:hypothetical protein